MVPIDAFNVLLHFLPLELHNKYAGSYNAGRLRGSGCWAAKTDGPRGSGPWVCHTIHYHTQYEFTTKAEWKTGGRLRGNDSSIYRRIKDDFRKQRGEYSRMRTVYPSCTVFKDIPVYSKRRYCQALYSVVRSTRLVEQCRDTPNSLGDTVKITIHWVLSYRNIDGNWPTVWSGEASLLAVYVSPAIVKSGIYLHYSTGADFRWRNLTICAKLTKIWPSTKHKTRS